MPGPYPGTPAIPSAGDRRLVRRLESILRRNRIDSARVRLAEKDRFGTYVKVLVSDRDPEEGEMFDRFRRAVWPEIKRAVRGTGFNPEDPMLSEPDGTYSWTLWHPAEPGGE
jgi:hypothetical protein